MYTTPTLPNHWIIRADDEQLYLVPNISGGWLKKTRYQGYTVGLERVAPETAQTIVNFVGGGFPSILSEDEDW